MVGDGLGPYTTFIYPVASWFEVVVNIDVEEDIAELYFNNESVYSWTWSEGSAGYSNTIAALNFHPNAEDNESDSYFVDDVSFQKLSP